MPFTRCIRYACPTWLERCNTSTPFTTSSSLAWLSLAVNAKHAGLAGRPGYLSSPVLCPMQRSCLICIPPPPKHRRGSWPRASSRACGLAAWVFHCWTLHTYPPAGLLGHVSCEGWCPGCTTSRSIYPCHVRGCVRSRPEVQSSKEVAVKPSVPVLAATFSAYVQMDGSGLKLPQSYVRLMIRKH